MDRLSPIRRTRNLVPSFQKLAPTDFHVECGKRILPQLESPVHRVDRLSEQLYQLPGARLSGAPVLVLPVTGSGEDLTGQALKHGDGRVGDRDGQFHHLRCQGGDAPTISEAVQRTDGCNRAFPCELAQTNRMKVLSEVLGQIERSQMSQSFDKGMQAGGAGRNGKAPQPGQA